MCVWGVGGKKSAQETWNKGEIAELKCHVWEVRWQEARACAVCVVTVVGSSVPAVRVLENKRSRPRHAHRSAGGRQRLFCPGSQAGVAGQAGQCAGRQVCAQPLTSSRRRRDRQPGVSRVEHLVGSTLARASEGGEAGMREGWGRRCNGIVGGRSVATRGGPARAARCVRTRRGRRAARFACSLSRVVQSGTPSMNGEPGELPILQQRFRAAQLVVLPCPSRHIVGYGKVLVEPTVGMFAVQCRVVREVGGVAGATSEMWRHGGVRVRERREGMFVGTQGKFRQRPAASHVEAREKSRGMARYALMLRRRVSGR